MTARTRVSERRRSLGATALVVAAGLLVPAAAASISQARQLHGALLNTQLDPQGAVLLEDIEVPFGSGALEVHSGVLVPTVAIDDRIVEWIFAGQARFRLDPPDAIEADQLELFTGQHTLDVSVDAAVLVRADDASLRHLAEQREPVFLNPPLLDRIQELHREWILGAERAASGIPGGVFNALIGDRSFADYFALWCRSYEVGDFIYEFDPEDTEPHTLAHFSPVEIRGWDRLRLERHLRHQQKRGRWLDTRIQDLGDWDIWLSGPWDPEGTTAQASAGFEPRHYELDVKIERDESTITGMARIDIEALEDGRKIVPLELFRDLQVERVQDDRGRPLFFFRSGGDLIVVLDEPSIEGGRFSLELDYTGKAISWVDRKVFDLDDTANWYPHCGTTDRATYDVTLRWPRSLDLLASGRVVDSGRERRFRWQRRVLDEPAIAFSFVLGSFRVERARAGDVELEIAFNKSTPYRLSEGVVREVIETVSDSLRYFETAFGPYPLDHLTVVTLPRRYSQSFLGFITLSDSILPPNAPPAGTDMDWFRGSTIAHEIAHQWWGNLIGWASYRDQWLSEAMANYAALQYWASTMEGGAAFLAGMSEGWRQSLNQPTPVGRTVEALGPIVLGVRLNSTLADNGYRAIVYRKGAVVLAMLARIVGQQPFNEMMRSLAEAASNRVVSTATFLKALEHMSGIDLDGFAQRYIYGTGIPEIYYDYEVTGDADNGWRVDGRAHLVARAQQQQVVQPFGDGNWDVVREMQRKRASNQTALVVPYRMILDDGGAAAAQRALHRRPIQPGQVVLEGESQAFVLTSRERPTELTLDPRGEILASFYSRRTHPKKVATLKAESLWLSGDAEAAEEMFRAALSATPGEADKAAFTRPWMEASPYVWQREDARIRLRLARLALDRDDEQAALQEIAAATEILGADDHTLRIERAALECRIDLRKGDFEQAFRRSKQALRLFSPRRQQRYWRLRGWQAQIGDWHATTDVLAVLAVAALETGRVEESRWALEGATERGVDLSAIEPLLAARLR